MTQYYPTMPMKAWMDYLDNPPPERRWPRIRHVLLQAHDVMPYAEEISRDYRHRAEWKNTSIMLDNGVCEMGFPMERRELMAAAHIVKPQILIPPDLIGNFYGTCELLYDFTALWSQNPVPGCKLLRPISMQVATEENLNECLGWWEDFLLLPTGLSDAWGPWGLPKYFDDYVAIGGGKPDDPLEQLYTLTRSGIVEKMYYYFKKRQQYHFLGLGRADVLENVLAMHMYKSVESCDTTVPIRLAMAGTEISHAFAHPLGPIEALETAKDLKTEDKNGDDPLWALDKLTPLARGNIIMFGNLIAHGPSI